MYVLVVPLRIIALGSYRVASTVYDKDGARCLGRLIWDRKSENKTGVPSSCRNSRVVPSVVIGDWRFLYAAFAKKKVLFAHSTSLPPRVVGSQRTNHDKTWGVYAPLRGESSLPSLGGVGSLCLKGLAWDVGA